MKVFVVDASVAAKWFIPEEHSDIAGLLLDENFELADSLEAPVVTADQKFANKVADPARVAFVADFLKA